MKKSLHSSNLLRGFSLLEIVVGLAVLGLLATVSVLGLRNSKHHSKREECTRNLKQVGLAFRTWALDCGDQFTMKVAVGNGGYSDFVGLRRLTTHQTTSRGVSGMFLTMSNELSTPKILICPAESETQRLAANTFWTNSAIPAPGEVLCTNDLNVSYFVGVDAQDTFPQMLLVGDHNLGLGDPASAPFQPWNGNTHNQALGTNNTTSGWMDNMHRRQGNVGLGDGSVQTFSTPKLREALRNTGDGGVSAAGPNGFPPGQNRLQFP